MEPSPEAYIERLAEVFREVWRVLDYIGVGWEDDPAGNVPGQMDMFGGEVV